MEGRENIFEWCLESEFQTLEEIKLNNILVFIICCIQKKNTAF